ncbi:uncharacterized protein LOC108850231 [Raphanus sativus]|uniref:Uncharacterized protein LOC108850231 n=1 Tax=Raphanus sativus TaxID=3726 RepID=A0A6J0N3S2_RAPSA|nr:uncharacterized protein LOC108850231 [Raphanus sativus]
METKNPTAKVLKDLHWLQTNNHFAVPPHTPGGGGLFISWKKDIDLQVRSSSHNFIDAIISYKGKTWQTTFVYGEPDQSKRYEAWKTLSSLKPASGDPWLLTGDFNEIIDNSEKCGGPERAEGTFCAFRGFLSENGLFDLKFSGRYLSWRGKRHSHLVLCRLDRTVSNSEWAEIFPSSRNQYLKFEGSDHRPLLTFLDTSRKKSAKIFRFDRRLNENEEIKKLITEIWESSPQLSVEGRLTLCRRAICTWSKKFHESSQKALEETKEKLEAALLNTNPDEELIHELNMKLLHLYKAEESFWQQRSRQLWLVLGDSNTGYFHAVAKGRSARNKFSVITDDRGVHVYEEEEISKVISAYYSKLFQSCPFDGQHTISEALQPCITKEQNEKLIMMPQAKEIKEATFAIHADKAPGPDGFSASFFQSNWEVVGPAVVKEIQIFFASGILAPSINKTHVRLIPKISGAQRVEDYRPIALCNIFYKIISKLLSIRLKTVLSSIISENQSAFVPGRAIADNVLITHESRQICQKPMTESNGTLFYKSYNDWDFIRSGLTGSCNVLLREVLSGLCKSAEKKGLLQGVRVARGSPRVSHLLFADDTMFFADDTMFFGLASPTNCETLVKILKDYERASGQMINKAKSSITFSSKTPPEVKEQVKLRLGITKEGGLGKYLGLPEHFGRKKKDLFTSIVDKIRQKAVSWSSKKLSRAGKLTMLKSVLSAIPTYTMSCFQLPVSLCKRIQSVLTRFWWDGTEDKKKISWVSWDRLTQPKAMGGLGLRDIQIFNQALLAKLAWRLVTAPESLLARVLLGKYCHGKHFLEVQSPQTCSHGWRGILFGRDLLTKNLGKAVGNGQTTRLWKDSWIVMDRMEKPMGPMKESDLDLIVSDLLTDDLQWNSKRINEVLPEYLEQILCIQPSRKGAEDSYIWHPTASGIYSTKSGYYAASISYTECVPLKTAVHIAADDSFKEVIVKFRSAVCLPPSGFTLNILPWIYWAIWLARNALIFEDRRFSPEDTALKGLRLAKEWLEAQGNKSGELLPSLRVQDTHRPPTSSVSQQIICHTDAAWKSDKKMAGLGWIFTGPSLATSSQGSMIHRFVNSPLIGEALAVRSALCMALTRDFTELQVCSDNKTLIRTISGESQSKEIIGIVSDIRVISSEFASISFSHIPISMNSVADGVAKEALLSSLFV